MPMPDGRASTCTPGWWCPATGRGKRASKALVNQKIVVGRRGAGIRVAPHLHNSVADIERFLETVRRTA
ncbi:MAG: hypothetical protein IT180_10330 [Acidobacteria bacterium]|nr:hypothetical protein [Acidobacteriota bacterium]